MDVNMDTERRNAREVDVIVATSTSTSIYSIYFVPQTMIQKEMIMCWE
jgi:hypothetical protein